MRKKKGSPRIGCTNFFFTFFLCSRIFVQPMEQVCHPQPNRLAPYAVVALGGWSSWCGGGGPQNWFLYFFGALFNTLGLLLLATIGRHSVASMFSGLSTVHPPLLFAVRHFPLFFTQLRDWNKPQARK